MMNDFEKIFLALVLLAAIIIGMPLAIIWALNTLFVLSIEYTFWNWLAVLVLFSVVNGSRIKSGS